MAWFLIQGFPRPERMPELEEMLRRGSLQAIQPQGNEIHRSLTQARQDADGSVWFEVQSFSAPPLSSERTMVFDQFFHSMDITEVEQGEGWHRIDEVPYLFPTLFQE
jgi:hypothetical protein